MLLDIICNFSHRIVERNRNISVSVNDTCCFILFLSRLEFRDFVYATCSFPDCPKELLCCSRGRKEVTLNHGIATVEPRNGTVAIADISLVHFYDYCRHPRTNCSFETFFSLFYCECFANRHGNFSAIVTQVSHVSRLFVLSVSSFNREQADLKFMSYRSNDNSNNENVKNKLFFKNTLGPFLLEVL